MMNTFKLDKYNLVVRPIKVIDCLSLDNTIPFQFFILKKEVYGVYESLKKEHEKEHDIEVDKEETKKRMRDILDISVLKYGDEIFNFNHLYQDIGYEGCLEVVSFVIAKSLVYFKDKLFEKGQILIKKNNALYIDELAKRYGKTPIEIICINKQLYNDMDAFIFNSFIANIAINEINERIKQEKNKAKRGR